MTFPIHNAPIRRPALTVRKAIPKRRLKPRRGEVVDEEFLKWLRTWPCFIELWNWAKSRRIPMRSLNIAVRDAAWMSLKLCGKTEAAHTSTPKRPRNDHEAMPLGVGHHEHPTAGGRQDSYHSMSAKFWAHHGIDRMEMYAALNQLYVEEVG